jgi:N-acetylmuramoyl-L-alanine amidase
MTRRAARRAPAARPFADILRAVNATRWTSVLVLALSCLVLPLWAADPVEEEEALPIYDSGVATLDLGPDRRFPVGYAVTGIGPTFTLHSMVAHLGGALKLGPMNQAHELTVAGTTFIFGPASAAVTAGTEIYSLSQRPIVGADGVKVPIDLLETVYGEQLSYDFQWNQADRTLTVRKLPSRQISVDVDLVHLQGVTTVVLQFPERPRYRVRPTPGQVSVELIGDSLAGSDRTTTGDELVREILQTPQGIRLVLAPNTEANDYTLQNPFRLVFDVYRSTTTAAAAPPALPTTPTRSDKIQTIVIDPGHGGENTGARGSTGTEEKEITLQLAQTLRSRLVERLPVRVVLTRTEDVDLPLDTRTAIANQQKADLFISLHVNSVPGPSAHGAETYFLSLEASDEGAERAAAVENSVDPVPAGEGDPLYDLQLILWDLAQSHYLGESQSLARLIQEELNETLSLTDRGVKQAPFRVLVGAAMPAVLVECGFLSNPEEEAKLLDPAYRAQLVEALIRAVLRYRAQKEGSPIPVSAGEAIQ